VAIEVRQTTKAEESHTERYPSCGCSSTSARHRLELTSILVAGHANSASAEVVASEASQAFQVSQALNASFARFGEQRRRRLLPLLQPP